jgi:glycosidase
MADREKPGGCPCCSEKCSGADIPRVPEWAKRVVWYQIFPERFKNSDPANDPKLEDIKGAYPHDLTPPWQIHPWTSDWYELQPYEQKNGKNIWFNIQRRRYGGDMQGILDRLDYLQDLGVTAIYLNPVFVSPSLHKYDAQIYQHIDPSFGPDPEGDRKIIAEETTSDASTWKWTAADRQMLKLIDEVHRRGMRIVFDGVFNHIGINNPFFQDLVKNQKSSKYRDWFIVKQWDDPAKDQKFDFKGWFGIRELPEWGRDSKGALNAGPKQYIFDITKRWMKPVVDGKPQRGIDGWRLDVAFCVGHPFWKDWSAWVRSLNPEAYLTAEIIDTVEANKPYLEGDEFTAVMNYNFAFAVGEYFCEKRINTSKFDALLKKLREAYHPEVAYVMQNLVDSHDTARIASHIVNGKSISYRNWQQYCDMSKPEKNPSFNTRKPTDDERKIQKLIAIMQMTYLGAPMVYYGDEAGMWGADDPCCRKPMVWSDMKYSDEVYLPDGRKREKPDTVEFCSDLFNHYKKLISIRNGSEALQVGDFKTLLADDSAEVYVFSRSSGKENVIVLLNKSNVPRKCTVTAPQKGGYTDLLNGSAQFSTDDKGSLSVEVPPLWARILKK